jgi:catechol 2,3-dioxygenase-like lactoylglutathione lyase family enzyme
MNLGLRHVALKTRDLPRTERFYVDVLGLRIAFPHRGMIFLETPGGLDHFGLHFSRARWKKVCARVKRAGVKARGRRGSTAIYIEDPNGYTVELYCD